MNGKSRANDSPGPNLIGQVLRLEGEIKSKNKEIAHNQNELTLLRRELETCVEIMRGVSKQLSGVTSDFKNVLSQHSDRMEELVLEKKMLGYSNDTWSNRSLAFQVELLKAKNEVKAVKAALESETRKVAQLEAELNGIRAGNDLLEIHRIDSGKDK
jgi:predicted  nucleic acid-binding Zn-ribbon protein